MLTTAHAAKTAAAPAAASPVRPLPKDLPWPDDLPEHRQLRGHDRWMNWALASIRQPAGYDARTGKQLFETTDVIAAPYPEHRAVVRLPAGTAFKDVIAAAQALSVDGNRNARYGNAQAVLQSESGSWYITMAGARESGGHIEPLPVTWGVEASARPRQRDVVALVGSKEWVNFSDRQL